MQNPKSITITGDGSVVPLSATALGAKWIRLRTPAANGADVLVGGSEVTSTVGYPIPKGTELPMPGNEAEKFGFYTLSEIKAYIGNNDKLNVLYGG